ncbi:hypothetical protein BLA29_013668, partial [Euroglyphus maynei]
MVQIDPSISTVNHPNSHQQQQYETGTVPMTSSSTQQQIGVGGNPSSLDGTIIDTNNTINNYPTYYNLDQNHLSETQVQHTQSQQQTVYGRNKNAREFSPMAKNLSSSPSSSTSNSSPPPITTTEMTKN